MSLKADPRRANSSRPRTGTRSLSRPRAMPCAACESVRRVRHDRPAFEVGDERDEAEREEEPEEEAVARGRVRRVDQRLRAHNCEAHAREIGDGRRDERAETVVAYRDRFRLPGADVHRPRDEGRRRRDNAVVAHDHERVGGAEAGARAQDVGERPVERDRDRDGADEALPRDDRDLARRRERRRLADAEPVDRRHGDVARRLEPVVDGRQVPALELPLERRQACEPRGLALGAVDALLVGGEHGAEPGLEARVDLSRLALAGNAREPPEGGGHRQEREQQEVEEELDLEATHRESLACPRIFKSRIPSADTSFE